MWRARADVAARGSGEALSLPKHFWGDSEPPLSVVQRLGSAGVGGGGISVALYVCYNLFYENGSSTPKDNVAFFSCFSHASHIKTEPPCGSSRFGTFQGTHGTPGRGFARVHLTPDSPQPPQPQF